MMPDSLLCSKIRAFYREQGLSLQTPVTVGLSGGADSTALTAALRELNVPLTAVHVCHHLRGEAAERDAEFCRELCARLEIPFVRKDVFVRENRDGRTLEEAARELRYEALTEECPSGTLLAVAHNANDAVETALFNLARGTGAAGLGIAPVRELSGGITLIRPILRCTREEILRELENRGLSFVEDETNAEEDASRNILRHACIPAMLRVNPKAVENAAAALERVREDHEILQKQAEMLATVPASARALREAPRATAARAFLLLYRHKDLTRRHMDALFALCEKSEGSGSVDLPGKIRAVREYDALRFLPAVPSQTETNFPEKTLNLDEPTEIPEIGLRITVKKTKNVSENSDCFYNIYVDSDSIHGILSVRARKTGDCFRAARSGCTKTVKKAMIDAHIPRSLRESCPVILCNGEIAAVRGLGASDICAVRDEKTSEMLEIRFEPILPPLNQEEK